MRNKFTLATASLLFVLVVSSFAFAQKVVSVDETPADLTQTSGNHFYVLHAMRTIHSAQVTYSKTSGNGNYGSLENLLQAELIDSLLASGVKYGYRFSMTTRPATATMQPGFDLNVTPAVRRPRALSYYQNEGCDIYGADKNGRNASSTDPVIDPCGVSLRSENETAAMASMRQLHSAQITYQATIGAGQFGTIQQLYDAGLYTTGFGLAFIWKGYRSEMSITPGSGTTPTTFGFWARPMAYGRTGVRSFYIDQTGVLRGADKNGRFAYTQDPPIDGCTDGSFFGTEQCAIQNLRIIYSAQITYAATVGNGNYGLHAQLYNAGLISPQLASGTDRGYNSVIGQTPGIPGIPAIFYAHMTPISYGVTGFRSFYIDQTGVVRAADRNGQNASVNDPPISQ